ncbi:MAG: DUF2125 domain-containing protein [Sphingomonadaceae bacterium]|uniref:hypothetical protein n=1 Tax=Thermaurantiacus sp. TaxID=2820283 RepID=UPI00298F34ED|nr:hypothetical protein [Thermaurantiacus sp.]MCS6987141.1 DUF2125 domain-containing protein [Sphingomonadaceae bacterium]MDW8415825.1 hypothetical protein [Thermaurantiacus sp.]
MPRRWPLWTTLVPLGVGALAWAHVWAGWRDRLAADLRRVLPPGTVVRVGGVPYRIEARTGPVALTLGGPAVRAHLQAQALVVNRQPWRTDRQVLNLAAPRLTLEARPIPPLATRIEAPAAQASLRIGPAGIARLSVVLERARVASDWMPGPLRAERLEFHLAETPTQGPVRSSLPVQAAIALAAEGARLAGGAPLALGLEAELVAPHPVRSWAALARGGAVELRRVALSDAEGEVVRASATFRPDPDGRWVGRGRLVTFCPATVRAALSGAPPGPEKRTRRPVETPFTVVVGGPVGLAPPPGPPPPIRGQAPPCPRLLGGLP